MDSLRTRVWSGVLLACACAYVLIDMTNNQVHRRIEALGEESGAPRLNIYRRAEGGYAYRFRTFPQPKHVAKTDYPEPSPITIPARVFSKKGRQPDFQLALPTRWTGHTSPSVATSTYISAHGSNAHQKISTSARAPRLVSLAQEDETTDEGEDMSFLDSPWMDEWLAYSGDILKPFEQRQLEEQAAREGIPKSTNVAYIMPHEPGEEMDYADWSYVHDEDAVQPLRMAQGESAFPRADANVNVPGAVLDGSGRYASYLAWKARAPRPQSGSVDGWLTDNQAYR